MDTSEAIRTLREILRNSLQTFEKTPGFGFGDFKPLGGILTTGSRRKGTRKKYSLEAIANEVGGLGKQAGLDPTPLIRLAVVPLPANQETGPIRDGLRWLDELELRLTVAGLTPPLLPPPDATPPGAQDWRDLAETCRETAHRLNATAGGPLDNTLLRGLLPKLAEHSRRLGLAALPLAWIRGDKGEGLAYCFPDGTRREETLFLYATPTAKALGALADFPGVTVRRRYGNHEHVRQEAAAAMESWLHFVERKAAELREAETLTPLKGTPLGRKRSEGDARKAKRDKPRTKRDKLREQRLTFCHRRHLKGEPWSAIYVAYNEKFPNDKTANRHSLRTMYENWKRKGYFAE